MPRPTPLAHHQCSPAPCCALRRPRPLPLLPGTCGREACEPGRSGVLCSLTAARPPPLEAGLACGVVVVGMGRTSTVPGSSSPVCGLRGFAKLCIICEVGMIQWFLGRDTLESVWSLCCWGLKGAGAPMAAAITCSLSAQGHLETTLS